MNQILEYIIDTLSTKTGMLGVATCVLTIVGFASGQIEYQAALAGLVGGLGLIFGREAIKKSEKK